MPPLSKVFPSTRFASKEFGNYCPRLVTTLIYGKNYHPPVLANSHFLN